VSEIDFNGIALVDIAFGPDGNLYLLSDTGLIYTVSVAASPLRDHEGTTFALPQNADFKLTVLPTKIPKG
jgi:hypothetical protein